MVLDGPADLIHARKKELTLSETARQRDAYRALVRPLPFGRLVDCSRPLGHVVADVRNEIISSMIGRHLHQAGRVVGGQQSELPTA
ncbi:hypothetical protein ACRAWG_11365 [Methylobacterium sp. P31]